jgi:hypothetical protein
MAVADSPLSFRICGIARSGGCGSHNCSACLVTEYPIGVSMIIGTQFLTRFARHVSEQKLHSAAIGPSPFDNSPRSSSRLRWAAVTAESSPIQ